MIREAYDDWNSDVEASFAVEVLDGPEVAPAPAWDAAAFDEGVARMGLTLSAFIPLMQDTRAGWPVNEMNEPNPSAFGIENAGLPTTTGSVGTYELAQDEAMILELSDHDVVHGGIQLGNVWLESLDYRTRQTSLNWHQSEADADGRFRYVLAHDDPGTANWLDVSDHPEGSIFIRWQDPAADDLPETPVVTVVPLAEVTDNLPDDYPTVTPEERTEALELRDAGINRRRNPAGAGPSAEPTESAAPASSDSDSSDSDTGAFVLTGVIAALVAGSAGWFVGRRRRA